MSFIRCTSNPEGLYVLDHIDGYIQWYWCPKRPLLSSAGEMRVPRKAFYAVCKQWVKKAILGMDCKISVDGFTAESTVFFTRTAKRVPRRRRIGWWINNRKPIHRFVRISYGKHVLHLWEVSWWHMLDEFYLDRYKKWWLKDLRKKGR